MQITIDDDTFHKWATERGYVLASEVISKLSVVLASTQLASWTYIAPQPGDLAPEVYNVNPAASSTSFRVGSTHDTAVASTFPEEVASLEQPEDLKPAEPPLTDKQTIRLLGELFEHYGNSSEANKACRALLDRYGATKASEIPPEHRAELARLVNSRHDYATADEFIASLEGGK
jgi:hypothetical protein